MNVQLSTFNFQLLKKHALEVVGSVWLALVAAQYVSGYFLGVDMDLRFAYIGMLVLAIVVALSRKG